MEAEKLHAASVRRKVLAWKMQENNKLLLNFLLEDSLSAFVVFGANSALVTLSQTLESTSKGWIAIQKEKVVTWKKYSCSCVGKWISFFFQFIRWKALLTCRNDFTSCSKMFHLNMNGFSIWNFSNQII